MNASFEHATKRASTGKTGYIDLFWPGVLLVEQKSADKNLYDAEFQARDYLPDLADSELPKALVMSDFKKIRIIRLDNHTEQALNTSELPQKTHLFDFLTESRDRKIKEEAEANAKAVEIMGELFAQLNDSSYSSHDASTFMMRLLFLFFGDDTALWEKDLFFDFVTSRTSIDGSDCGAQLSSLFQTLDQPLAARSQYLDNSLARFPYVNGGLFAERIETPAFNKDMRDALIACAQFDWRRISPAIFGSMFQTIKTRDQRRDGGEHYTTETNILKTLKPLFLDELNEKLHACGTNPEALRRFRDRLAKYKFLDPACGCGNFLLVAYREMRTLELEALRRIAASTGQLPLDIDITGTLRVSPEQFHGIEIAEWPAEIAKTAFFIIDHQPTSSSPKSSARLPNGSPSLLLRTSRWPTHYMLTGPSFARHQTPLMSLVTRRSSGSTPRQQNRKTTHAQSGGRITTGTSTTSRAGMRKHCLTSEATKVLGHSSQQTQFARAILRRRFGDRSWPRAGAVALPIVRFSGTPKPAARRPCMCRSWASIATSKVLNRFFGRIR